MDKKVEKKIKDAALWAIEVYRELHQWPELGNEEYKTAERIEEKLELLGIPFKRMLNTGVVAILNEEKAQKGTIAIRADMDALLILEQTNLSHQSQKKGLMHACGHDVHMAVLLGTARILNEMKEKINGCVKFVFQPAEETTGGAYRMLTAGCLDQPKVDCIIGLHVKPELNAGSVGIHFGQVHAASDMFRIIVKGEKSHGAAPQEGVDAILAGANIISNVQGIVSRMIDPLDSAVISIGKFQGGTAGNILADEAILEGTIRSFTKGTRQKLLSGLSRMAMQTAKGLGASARVTFQPGYEALINDECVANKLEKVAQEYLGNENVYTLEKPTMGVDDFSAFLKETPGAFLFLGSGFKEKENAGIHTEHFCVDESCILTGIEIETYFVLQMLQGRTIREIKKSTQ